MIAGKYRDQFLVDWYQGGAGTSANMNANEVLANIGLELTRPQEGRVPVPRAARRSQHVAVDERLVSDGDQGRAPPAQRQADRGAAAARRRVPRQGQRVSRDPQDGAHRAAGRRADDGGPGVPRVRRVARERDPAAAGRREVPLRREHGRDRDRQRDQRAEGLPESACAAELAKLIKKPIVPATDMFAATWDQQGFVVYSSALKSLAIKLSKIASDLILLASGPRAGLNEINLPALQPGSSIMPGKVNPVIPELVNVIAFRVMGNDAAVDMAAHSGQLQLNAYEPLEGLAMMESQELLRNGSAALRTKCVDGITVNEKVLAHYMETTVGIVTALNPVLGYEKATELANEAYKSGKGLLEVIREKKVLTEAQIKDLLDPVKLTESRQEQIQMSRHSVSRCRLTLLALLTTIASMSGDRCALAQHSRIGRSRRTRTSSSWRPAARSPAQRRPGTQSGYTSGAVTIDAMLAAVPGIDKLANVKGEQIANVGSQDMSFDILLKVAKRINELAPNAGRRRLRDHARHRHDGGDGLLPEPHREDRQAGRDGGLDAAVDGGQRGRPAESLQRGRRRGRSAGEGPRRAGRDERRDPRRALADQDQHHRRRDLHVAAARPGRRRQLRQERLLQLADLEAHDARASSTSPSVTSCRASTSSSRASTCRRT